MKKYLFLAFLAFFVFISVAKAESYNFETNLTIGSSGADVVALQTFLETHSYLVMPEGVPKGYFGLLTQMAVAKYQTAKGITPAVGYVGPVTRAQITADSQVNQSSITVTSPNGGENWQIGINRAITWTTPTVTYVDIKLIPYQPPCTTEVCPMIVTAHSIRAPFVIANHVSLDTHSYTWRAGDYRDEAADIPNAGASAPIYPGQYQIQICESDTNNCDSSDAPFTLSSNDKSPVVNGIDAPTKLSINEKGVWTIRASDPSEGTLSYFAHWGDEPVYMTPAGEASSTTATQAIPQFVQSSSFPHSYDRAGTYTITFTIENSSGLMTQANTTVVVTDPSAPLITVTAPNGGENWKINATRAITWRDSNYNSSAKIDLYLGKQLPVVCIKAPCGPFFEQSTYVLDKNIPNTGVYNWIVGTDIVNNPIPPGSYGLRICVSGTDNCDLSDEPFTLVQ
ncbi:MAG: peptidoglycan-binding domain-containing protein [Candidatus Pacebacteria bacterium]|nr:peptidoglycan-binding domain-containing protein [Candidatus Paceibacterota bacterium]